MASEEEQKHQSLLEYQDIRSVVSLAYMESKLTKTTLMKIDLRKVLATVNQEIELLFVRNGGALLVALTKIMQKKGNLLLQEIKNFLESLKNKPVVTKKNVALANSDAIIRKKIQKNIFESSDSNIFNATNTSSTIESLSNQSIQNPRNVARKDEITLLPPISPFKPQTPDMSQSILEMNDYAEDSQQSNPNPKLQNNIYDQNSTPHPEPSPHQAQPQELRFIDEILNGGIRMRGEEEEVEGRLREILENISKDEMMGFREKGERKERRGREMDQEIVMENVAGRIDKINLEDLEIETTKFERKEKKIDLAANFLKSETLSEELMQSISMKLSMIDITNISSIDIVNNHEQKEVVPVAFTFQDEYPENQDNYADERKTEISINDRSNLLDVQGGFSNKKIISAQKETIKLEKNEENTLFKIKELSRKNKIVKLDEIIRASVDKKQKALTFLDCLVLTKNNRITMNQTEPLGSIEIGIISD